MADLLGSTEASARTLAARSGPCMRHRCCFNTSTRIVSLQVLGGSTCGGVETTPVGERAFRKCCCFNCSPSVDPHHAGAQACVRVAAVARTKDEMESNARARVGASRQRVVLHRPCALLFGSGAHRTWHNDFVKCQSRALTCEGRAAVVAAARERNVAP